MHLLRGILATCLAAFTAGADEGMWLFNQPPRAALRERYNFDVTDDWLDRVQRACVRFNTGGSGCFVSEDGLLISNHHVAADALQKLSTPERNYYRNGFHARTREQELKCHDLELNVLQSIEDVTVRVNAAVTPDAAASDAFAARRKVIAEIEKESMETTGLRSDVITLWQGGAYHLYRFKRYTDVRVVFAPEHQIAFYGGDPDNFEFPRHDLDICLLRAYENGIPAKITNHLRFSAAGPKDGDFVMVAGHPGRTSRLLTMAELENVRDQGLPHRLKQLRRLEVMYGAWSARSEENARRVSRSWFGVKNGRKALEGRLAGLLDPGLMSSKAKVEMEFKARLAASQELAPALKAFDRITEATRVLASQAVRHDLIEGAQGFHSESFGIARTLLRSVEERARPNGDRLREYSDAGRASLELGLFSTKPIYADVEILTLAGSLTQIATELGWEDPTVKAVLAGKSPRERAAELIGKTRVREIGFRRELYEGGADVLRAANDPMIELARLVDAEARALRKVSEEQAEIKQQAHAAIGAARNALLGISEDRYPDATFTLRLSFGSVKGYEEQGELIPSMTTFGGLYQRAAGMKNRPPFDLPQSWQRGKPRLNLRTPMNFVSTCDIIGGNSGSPVVNRKGEFVGIIFDGNLQSLAWDYAFDDRQGRATSVHSTAILEALKKIYTAGAVARELETGKIGL